MDELSRWYENMTYQEAKDILREKLDYMKKNFIAAGYYMKYIRDNELFREDGYESIWEFAEDNYGIKKSTASRWMSMNDKFSQGGNSPVLAEEFRDFEKSQLQEMLYLDDKQIETVTPDMTVKEIREVRKPAEPTRKLKKPNEPDRQYLKAAAIHLIKSLHDWFLADFMNRVEQVDRSPVELKKKLGKDRRCWHFSTEKGVASINLFDDCVQVWDEGNECIGDFDWFYLAAAIQSMWNIVAMENAQKSQHESVATSQQQEEVAEYIPGKCMHNPELACSLSEEAMRTPGTGEGNCGEVCCWECLKEDCKLRCNASEKRDDREETVATSQQVEAEPVVGLNLPEEEFDPEPEVITEENVEVVNAGGGEPTEELYEEASDQSDIDLLQEELEKAKNTLDLMLSCYSENDIRVRKQKLLVGALAGMISDLDAADIPEPQQPELPIFKNNDQRKAWLRDYKAWGLWYEDKNIGAKYYKYDFENGARLIAEVYDLEEVWGMWKPELETCYLHLIGGPEPAKNGAISKWIRHEKYCKHPSSETELMEFLKYVQKGGGVND